MGCLSTSQQMSSFIATKLDRFPLQADTSHMGRRNTSSKGSGQFMAFVRQQIERGGERLWKLEDFRDLPFMAVAQALSRLTRQGRLERLSKGVYYSSRNTAFGKSRPNPATIQKLASRRQTVFPSGIAAANLLGFTTQTAKKNEVATRPPAPKTRRQRHRDPYAQTRSMGRPLRKRCGVARLPAPGGQNERAVTGRNHPPHHYAVVGERALRAPAQNCGFGAPTRPCHDRRCRRTAREKSRGAASPAQFTESLFTIRLWPARRTTTRPRLAGSGTPLT